MSLDHSIRWIPGSVERSTLAGATPTDVLGSIDPFGAGRWIVAKTGDASFDTLGLPAVTVTSPTAAAAHADADGYYVRMTTAATEDSVAGITTALPVTQRRHDPDVVFCFKVPTLKARTWFGLFSADPSAYLTLDSADSTITSTYRPVSNISGAGCMVDYYASSPQTDAPLTDVAWAHTPKTFTRSSGSFIKDGFRVGQSAFWDGWSASELNLTSSVITTLTDTVMTITDELYTSDVAAGESVSAAAVLGVPYVQSMVGGTAVVKDTSSLGIGVTGGFTANTRQIMRIRKSPVSSTAWEFSLYDLSTRLWTAHSITNSALSSSTALNLYFTTTALRGIAKTCDIAWVALRTK